MDALKKKKKTSTHHLFAGASQRRKRKLLFNFLLFNKRPFTYIAVSWAIENRVQTEHRRAKKGFP